VRSLLSGVLICSSPFAAFGQNQIRGATPEEIVALEEAKARYDSMMASERERIAWESTHPGMVAAQTTIRLFILGVLSPFDLIIDEMTQGRTDDEQLNTRVRWAKLVLGLLTTTPSKAECEDEILRFTLENLGPEALEKAAHLLNEGDSEIGEIPAACTQAIERLKRILMTIIRDDSVSDFQITEIRECVSQLVEQGEQGELACRKALRESRQVFPETREVDLGDPYYRRNRNRTEYYHHLLQHYLGVAMRRMSEQENP